MAEISDIRKLPDRRKRPTPSISRYTLWGGRRRAVRREEDRKKYRAVDAYSTPQFMVFLALAISCVVDAFLTLVLIRENVVFEANPVLSFYLEYGAAPFVFVKFLITAAALSIFYACKNFSLAKAGMYFASVMYIFVVVYEFVLAFYTLL